jgi:VanZ family protein
MASARTIGGAIAGAVALAVVAVATLIPADMQIRTGLHWETEHFLAYFIVTAIFCLAWPRPVIIGGVLTVFSVLLEASQGLTPDRQPDLRTALAAAGGVLSAAFLALLVIAATRTWKARKSV